MALYTIKLYFLCSLVQNIIFYKSKINFILKNFRKFLTVNQAFLENPLKNGTLFKMTVFPSLEKKGANTGKGGVARFSFSLTGKERWFLAAG